jgi:ketosteroid isomerase-like protein
MRLQARPLLPALPLLLAAACAPGAPPPAQSGSADPVKQEVAAAVSAATDSLTAAMNAHDADRILAFFDLGPDFVYVSCTDVVFGGEMFGNITRSLHAQRKGVTYKVTPANTTVLGPDAAVVSIRTESSDTLASNPVLTTRALSKGVDGQWRIVYQHQSWPGCKAPRAPHPGMSPEAMAEAAADTVG